MKENEFQKRIIDFAVSVLMFLPKLPKTPECSVIRYQLVKSSSSSGANYSPSQIA